MAEMYLASTKTRLVLIGLAVVGFSVLLSLLATHTSLMVLEEADYQTTMIVALLIPLMVAPPSYGYVAWLSWKLKNAHDRLDFLAHRDALTTLKNRRAFVEEATARITAAGPQVLVMIDIDHFKHINDRLGHAGGDMALRHTADILSRTAPTGSLLARLGGEEFGLLVQVPSDDGPAALNAVEAQVEAMRQQLKSLPLIKPQGLVHVTASFGLTISRPDEPLDALLSRADKAMYVAKDAGRDRLHAICWGGRV